MEIKDSTLEIVSRNIHKIAKAKGLTTKQLADHAGISYTTLFPILKGSRDFRVSSLITIANALNITPNELLSGTYECKEKIENQQQYNYLASFVSNAGLTHCQIYNIKLKKIQSAILPFGLFCTDNVFDTLEKIKSAIQDTSKKEINWSDIAVYASMVAYEHLNGRAKLNEYGTKTFGKFIIEPDWMTLHKGVMPHSNGILITINDGMVLSFSTDNGKTLHKRKGYHYPISDEGGNIWLGCQAITYAINVAEGVEKRSLLSDRILSLVNSDLNLLATKVFDTPNVMYKQAASILKELAHKKTPAYQILKHGFDSMWEHIKQIDSTLHEELPVCLAGSIGALYEDFVPNKRLIKFDAQVMLNGQFEYTMKKLLGK